MYCVHVCFDVLCACVHVLLLFGVLCTVCMCYCFLMYCVHVCMAVCVVCAWLYVGSLLVCVCRVNKL